MHRIHDFTLESVQSSSQYFNTSLITRAVKVSSD